MGDRVTKANVGESITALSFKCPGCGDFHFVQVANPSGPNWTWNGSADRPTFTPSLLVRSGHYSPHRDPANGCWCGKEQEYGFACYICHSHITDGKIQFLGDCTHPLAGKTVDLAEIAP